MTFAEKIATATIADATAWKNDTEKFLFCIDWLEISASRPGADHLVDLLEAQFEATLAGFEEYINSEAAGI